MPNHPKIQVGIDFIQRLAQYDPNMQLSTACVLLYVARFQDRKGGVTTSDLMKWLGFSPASSSRNSYYWGEGTPDMPNSGFGLLRSEVDPLDRRRKHLKLTPRGEVFVSQLEDILDGTSKG